MIEKQKSGSPCQVREEDLIHHVLLLLLTANILEHSLGARQHAKCLTFIIMVLKTTLRYNLHRINCIYLKCTIP